MRNQNKKRFKDEKFNSMPTIERIFKAEAIDDDSTKITIYGDIGESWWGEYITASDVERMLKDVTSNTIHVHINSYGGDAFDGIAIRNQLKDHQAKIIVHVDGIAASAASIIAMAGDEIIMGTGSMLMIHEGSTFAWGNKAEIEKTLNSLKKLDTSLVDVYMTRYQGERSEIETMLQNETWFTANEAVDIGLADKVSEEKAETKVENKLDSEAFKNSVLERFRQNQESPAVASGNNNILSKFKRQ